MAQIFTLKSSAGAGKTFSLAHRYLSLVIDDLLHDRAPRGRPESILAITFTNKAATEMRGRILEWMKRIVLGISLEGSGDDAVAPLVADADAPRRSDDVLTETLRRRMEEVLEKLLKDFYDFKVGTIDGFVNLTLKASAFKLDLPPEFEISTESSRFMEEALDEALQQILEDGKAQRVFDDFLTSYVTLQGATAGWNPKTFLKDIISVFWGEEAKENLPFSGAPLSDLSEAKAHLEAKARELLWEMSARQGLTPYKLLGNALSAVSLIGPGEPKLSNFFRRPTFAESLTKGSAPSDAPLEDLWQTVRSAVRRYVEALASTKYVSYVEVYRLFKRCLLTEVTLKRRTVLIEELNRLLQQVIAEEYFVPEVYYSLADQYRHFLIDEFQDTSGLQWQNIEVLASEALGRGGSLFLVGDKKQAIYRWRGGNPDLVDEVSAKYGAFGVKSEILGTNYRSGERIVAFNCALFDPENLRVLAGSVLGAENPGSVERIVDTYRDSRQRHLPRADGEGYVRVERIVETGDDDDPHDEFTKDERFAVTAERTKGLVAEILHRGNVKRGDVAILTRRREEAELMVKTLLGLGIPVRAELTVSIRNHRHVREVINFLSFVDGPDDDLALASFLAGEIAGGEAGERSAGWGEWLALARLTSPGEHLFRVLRKSEPSLWEEHFEWFLRRAGFLPLYEFTVLFLKHWRVFERFPREAPYLLHLLELIKEREAAGHGNLTKFLAFWNDGERGGFGGPAEADEAFLLKTPEQSDAVGVYTIHKAKGLQFPVVILPFLRLTSFAQSDSPDRNRCFVRTKDSLEMLYIKRDYREHSTYLDALALNREGEYLLDELNSVYVACTRAQRELYVMLTRSVKRQNLLIDYCFGLEAFHTFSRGNVIEIGQPDSPTEGAPSRVDDGEQDSTGAGAALVPGPEADELLWTERLRRKLIDPRGSSLEGMKARTRGDVLHAILAAIPRLPEGEPSCLDECLGEALSRYLDPGTDDEVRQTLRRVLDNPAIRPFFQAGEGAEVLTEQEIVDGDGNTFKVDRIIISDDRVDVVDYKTGGPRRPEHRDQVARYGSLLEAIYPGKRVCRHIIYLDEGEVLSL